MIWVLKGQTLTVFVCHILSAQNGPGCLYCWKWHCCRVALTHALPCPPDVPNINSRTSQKSMKGGQSVHTKNFIHSQTFHIVANQMLTDGEDKVVEQLTLTKNTFRHVHRQTWSLHANCIGKAPFSWNQQTRGLRDLRANHVCSERDFATASSLKSFTLWHS